MILGPESSWRTAFEQGGIWGVKDLLYPEWKALEPGEIIFFFATKKPISGVIGVGKVQNKFVQDKPLWPDEIEIGKVIYPYRFEFQIDYALEQTRWRTDRLKTPLTIQEMRRGICLLMPRTVEFLYSAFRSRFNHEIIVNEQQSVRLSEPQIAGFGQSHKAIQDMVFQVGRLNRLISEKEYPMEDERLDVVWRRVERSVPTYVFEIQVGGDIYHALGKLKHAYDLWNSNIILIARHEDVDKAQQLLLGTFHEINDKVKILSLETILELHQLKLKWTNFEKKIGLL